MKPIIVNNSDVHPFQIENGAIHINDKKTQKARLRKRLGLSKDTFSQKVLDMFEGKKETISNKALAIQNLKNVRSKSGEDVLLKIVSKGNQILSHEALAILSLSGTKKAFNKLSKLKPFPTKILKRKKDFAQLIIGYRYHLTNTDEILKRLLKDTSETGKIEEFSIKFKSLKSGNISKILSRINKTDFGVNLSQNVALVTPSKKFALLSVFRKDGQLFMTANVTYDHEKESFTLGNSDKDKTRTKSTSDFKIDLSKFVTINLTFIRKEKNYRY